MTWNLETTFSKALASFICVHLDGVQITLLYIVQIWQMLNWHFSALFKSTTEPLLSGQTLVCGIRYQVEKMLGCTAGGRHSCWHSRDCWVQQCRPGRRRDPCKNNLLFLLVFLQPALLPEQPWQQLPEPQLWVQRWVWRQCGSVSLFLMVVRSRDDNYKDILTMAPNVKQ